MKKLILLLIFGLVLASCKSQSEPIENDFYNCLINTLSEEEKTKIKPIIKGFENHLIEKGILESSRPESYRKIYEKIAKTGTYDFSNDFDFSRKISFLNKQNNQELIECHMNIFKSEKYLNSKIRELNEKIRSKEMKNSTVEFRAQIILDYMTVEDFSLAYHRLNTLMFIEQLK